MSEQRVVLTGAGQATLTGRRIAVRLDQPTRDGDTTLYILTNLPPEGALATVVARVIAVAGGWRPRSKCWPPP